MVCSRSLTYVHLGTREHTLNWVGERTHTITVSSCNLLFFSFLFILNNTVFSFMYIFVL